jgi:DNA modification methylase
MELPEWFIRLFTEPGDIVCDPFLGSGTSYLAAQELGRSSIGIEIDENYFRLAQERLSKSETS